MTLYALLVGINEYPIAPLRGSLNDIQAITEYLQKQITPETKIKILTDEQATRQAIIDEFRNHLGQAKDNDIVLFYYSGHGSQEEASEEFQESTINQRHETLVCWDSRREGGLDLVDKELCKLINEVSLHNPHVVVILDCCHSGGLRRNQQDYTARSLAIRSKRSLSNFIFSLEEINSLSEAKCIFLAACQSHEKAYETLIHKQYRGLFSSWLLDTLIQSNGNINYQGLFWRCQILTNEYNSKQNPYIKVSNSTDLYRQFLGNHNNSHYFSVVYLRKYGWVLNKGAIDGILPILEEKAELLIFTNNSFECNQNISKAEVVEVLPHLSKIRLLGSSEILNFKLIYKAIPIFLPLRYLKFYLAGDKTGISLIREIIKNDNSEPQYSPFISESSDLEAAAFCISAQNDQYIISSNTNKNCFQFPPLLNYSHDNAQKVIQTLGHIAQWENLAFLSNPNSSLSPDAIQLQIVQGEEETEASEITLKYDRQTGEPPSFRIKITNHSDQALYCILLNLTERYSVTTKLLDEGIWLENKETAWALQGESIYAKIPENLRQQGITKYKDIIKLIISTSRVNPMFLELDALDTVLERAGNERPKRQPFNARMLDLSFDDEETSDDWITKEIVITTIDNCDDTQALVVFTNDDKNNQTDFRQQLVNHKTQFANKNNILRIGVVLLLFIVTASSFFLWTQRPKQFPKNLERTYLNFKK